MNWAALDIVEGKLEQQRRAHIARMKRLRASGKPAKEGRRNG